MSLASPRQLANTLLREIFNYYDYFLKLSGFPDLFAKVADQYEILLT